MDFAELIFESISTFTLNKLRTGLATLGIVIGIGSVIALVSLGQSSQKAVAVQIQSLGSNLLTVIPGAASTGFVRGAQGGATTLTYEDAKALQTSSQVTAVKNVSPELSRRTQVTTGRKNTNTQILGVVPIFAEVRKVNLASGTFISQKDVEGMGRVAVLGPQVVADLFEEGANPIGQQVRINNQSFRVTGVTVPKGGTGFQNQDDMVFVPLTTAQKLVFGTDYISSISVEAQNEKVMTQAQDEIGYLLLARHKLKDPSQADFTIFSQNDILGAASAVTGTFTALLSGIAAISLLVGGIGIMNIMLVTVTERTREIGLRKALGAKKKAIITQFLTEAIILTFAGGVIGMGLGTAASFLISNFINLPFTLSLQSILLAIGVSVSIGILFGWYPAQKAANLQPIEALRYE
ncbi:MAG: ABC transporter, permease protein [Candidatus Amesbacteria bacterium GW2011_GWB1_47_26]|uniref:ABC transporter, permease protein n=1 Tax=Candidatus Amesbacteria bacterium GW2011_GWC2_45_19 TaxID=1618366 RepID=A0A0G1M559_9BACT|nr:MAG: ABC transporter, permease protein [Candidatus Amesbacteria bacterium GW2011_GWC2_45_19]KKU38548.1 MAG: ABC transporter, permease protein [Candidatus Amesbacteria bacterium GW2011_GWA1_46_35]KKU69631.1 MAG: ABC transporter, permease protein [Microgenomates group bacterium GW2011_GWC1_47_20]KKU74603.1 MAG: ABC transporter, permease protein [Candidatus Amesbacteria bacterium GW2011_GWB1_47_26]KKU79945.1 MAG: ABC transporter, permease protein [Candidatus Amesbacteria bacterium GW2011_GWA2_4